MCVKIAEKEETAVEQENKKQEGWEGRAIKVAILASLLTMLSVAMNAAGLHYACVIPAGFAVFWGIFSILTALAAIKEATKTF